VLSSEKIMSNDKELVQGMILAAGLSTRMGRQKLLIKIGGVPVIARVVRAALESRLNRVVLVTGPTNFELLESLGPENTNARLLIAVNELPEEGMSSSLKTGMMMVTKGTLGIMVILGDQPFLTSAIINRLLDEFDKQTDCIVAPMVQGRRSNPVIFPADLFPELRMVTGDIGGKSVLLRNPERVAGIEMGGYYDDKDLDTPEDLQGIKSLTLENEII
jgi:molybdenum cofactor cytidylyltransferase